MENVLIYIHGFMSSPQSVKAQQTIAYVGEYHPDLTVEVPQVPNYPLDAAQMLESLAGKYEGKNLRFIGSSMGGFMSTYLVEKFGGKAVLINPAVRPFELLEGFLGTHVNPYTNQEFTLQGTHIQQLLDLNTPELSDPQAYWALLQTDDETLDYRQAEQKYANSRLTIEQGGDHSFQNYADHLPDIFKFLLS
ncbi:YqiA/YcfP family alpha/beta fold hydrolase [Aliiglaciecola sp. 3_MG-2023]|uniref:YqiA/YcfP family alpha/beta fold hydrolase n=1 Tax=Aliiglaciecola sp. 3_MG-2023 TaxID=3062644 RepID=UPI0026E2E562|nr:YqiA/YcfP family alpha/beta fold hydrolase [Aliiglaciecola sp. 3_MG-2023]MDO6692222.1 YqiA/YcfP family alpha/beta fold hydrolase [Aliiglaciecola sp. 3_MG-2023]